MADGKNNARALRILEIMNDFRTLQLHIRSHITQSSATPPTADAQNLAGYALLRQCSTEAQLLLRVNYNQRELGFEPGRVPATEVQKASLQRIILDASARRFQAHRVYLRVAAAVRWIQQRQQVLQGAAPNAVQQLLRQVDQRLSQEFAQITDAHVYSQLRAADKKKGYWLDEDPSLERILAWIKSQQPRS